MYHTLYDFIGEHYVMIPWLDFECRNLLLSVILVLNTCYKITFVNVPYIVRFIGEHYVMIPWLDFECRNLLLSVILVLNTCHTCSYSL